MRMSLHRAILLALGALAAGATQASPASSSASSSVSPPPALVPIPSLPSALLEPPATTVTVAPDLPAPEARPVPAIDPAPAGPQAPGTPALTTGAEVFARLHRNLNPKACEAGSNSARWRQRYAGHPATFSRRLRSVLPLLDFVSAEVERAGLPAEFAFIPLVESWYQPAAVGPGGPSGMWQMIASTARNHGIQIRDGYDGRLSPVESTRAALSYLKVLKNMFGNWQAIVMAYNAGEGRLQNALRRAGSRVASASERRPHGLSNITYDYVDKLQALSCLVLQPQRHKLQLPVDARFAALGPMLMDPGVHSLDEFARSQGTDAAELKRLNPGFRGGRVVGGVPRMVLSPPGAGAARRLPQAEARLAASDAAAATGPNPETDAEIAEILEAALAPALFDVDAPTASDARSVALVPASLPAAPEGPAAFVGTLTAAQSTPSPALAAPHAPLPTVHTVRSGESLASIASYYQLPIEQLRRANGLGPTAVVQPGQLLQLVP